MQVIHALVQVALRWREDGSSGRAGRNSRKGGSSTRPPRGDQVDGLPRVVIRNLGKLIPNAKQPGLQNFVVILKFGKVSNISFCYREQNMNLQVRRTVWYGCRLRLCVLECFPNGSKTEIHMSKLSNFFQNFRNAPKASIDSRGWFAMCFSSFQNELERDGSRIGNIKKKTNFKCDRRCKLYMP